MPKRLLLLFCALLLALAPLGTPPRAETLRLATLEWPPYIGHDLPEEGYVAELVRKTFARSGLAVEFVYLPWTRAVSETRAGRFHGYLPEYYSPELHEDFVLSRPFPGGPLHLFTPKGRMVAFGSLKDLVPYRIGVVRGYANTPEFDAADFLNKYQAANDVTNLRMLARGRIDLMVLDLNVARFLAARELGSPDAVRPLLPALGDKALYVCFPKSRSDHERLREALDKGLRILEQSGAAGRMALPRGMVLSPVPETP
ncbi:substrate-binding periplasmic protein [Desulfocurvus sp. DL9XJH121]